VQAVVPPPVERLAGLRRDEDARNWPRSDAALRAEIDTP
jgi:hypothetical protein